MTFHKGRQQLQLPCTMHISHPVSNRYFPLTYFFLFRQQPRMSEERPKVEKRPAEDEEEREEEEEKDQEPPTPASWEHIGWLKRTPNKIKKLSTVIRYMWRGCPRSTARSRA